MVSAPPSRSRSKRHRDLLAQLHRWARQRDVTILLEGEPGTGKSYLARQVHALSPRANGPYQEVSLAALDDDLAGSDLFGHVVGAFTDAKKQRAGAFVAASQGTLFLDELGKASSILQRKLLTAIEDRTITPYGSDRAIRVDVRIVAATNVGWDHRSARDRRPRRARDLERPFAIGNRYHSDGRTRSDGCYVAEHRNGR